MKRIIILVVVFFIAVTFNAEAKKHYNGVGGYFYSQLSPYGSWIEVDYGVIVWRPTIIRSNWMPYQMGNWVWTYDGWYWDSYEPFGFITYHYGRWYFDDYYGWLWYPDYEWAPAWVEWRYNNNYIGWAPLHPYAVFSVSVGIYYTNSYYTPYNHWNYVGYGNFCDPYVYNYYVAPGSKYRIHSGTKSRNNFVYYNGRIQNRGVDVKYIGVRSGKEIKQRDVIRVSDSRDLNRDSYKDRNEIRTLDLNRDQLIRNDLGRMEIKRDNRKTSVDMDKVKIGQREKVTTEKRDDNSRERTLDGRKTDQIRKDVKDGVDKVVKERNNKSPRTSDVNVSRENVKVETTKRKSDQTGNQIDSQRKNKNISLQKEDQVKQDRKTQSTESVNQKRQQKEESSKVKKEDTKSSNNDRISQNNVSEQNKNDNQKNRNNVTKQNDSRTKEQDKSQVRKR